MSSWNYCIVWGLKMKKYFTEYDLKRYHQITIFEAIEQLEKSCGGDQMKNNQTMNLAQYVA